MKRNLLKASFIAALLTATFGQAQEGKLDNLKPRDKTGLTVFENPKDTVTTFDHLRVKVGGAFALQFQAIQHENNATPVLNSAGVNTNQLFDIGNNINLPTANLDLDVALYDGVNLHLRTFLSSRHHNETYVKGGYLQVDKLDFIEKGFAENIMKYATIKVGQDQINYGDAQLRRSDNAYAIMNPFVGNYLMDAYATFPFAEVYYRRNGVIVMGGVTNGRLNQTATGGTSAGIYGKLGYDKQLTNDLRVRLTGSFYNIARASRLDFYNGDRAGSRYYFVMENTAATSKDQMRSGMVDPDFQNTLRTFMINPFIKYKGLEFFGIFESASGRNLTETERRTYNQYAAELIYRFGSTENFYFGGRYNKVDGKLISGDDISVTRYNIGGGWFMTKNILTKLEYVNQKYDGYPATNIKKDGKFNGFVAEAVISF
ncbi:hypothetical protein [Epilithonimonas hungarica]|uniref:Porin n=1 Tax=Epilithonimonas hungarica TaxID=454006 RepID=A0A1G7IMH4_9FLAO|nr:hypothetical protein [Epilithonimonas hungarica]MDP9956376.1 hypothetical protein [Epilithonimonas hungarica]MPT30267.1 hypothetical protein [Chryseobacterium sp.]SDF13758.1 hypothetical protein SAMN05421825_1129 [Epilithonimonas hungarica]